MLKDVLRILNYAAWKFKTDKLELTPDKEYVFRLHHDGKPKIEPIEVIVRVIPEGRLHLQVEDDAP